MEQQQYSMRMVIIPEDVYTTLLNQNKSLANPLDAHILESSNKLNEILHNPNMDDSARFQLYSNEMKRLQKVRADRSEQPSIKDVLSAQELSSAQPNTPKRVRKKSSPTTSGVEDEKSEDPHDDDFETPQKQSPRAERKQKFEALRNYLDNNRQRFGIREDGYVFKDPSHRAIYTYGKYENIAKALTGLTSRRPPGLQRLLESIRSDDYARQLILDFDSPSKKITTPKQKGKGPIRTPSAPSIRLSPPPPHTKCQKNIKKTVYFCPEIWH